MKPLVSKSASTATPSIPRSPSTATFGIVVTSFVACEPGRATLIAPRFSTMNTRPSGA